MNHNAAIDTKAAEQYVLGQMNDVERDAYEEHMFSCAACSEEVKYLAEFGQGMKTIFAKPGADKLYQLEEKPGFWAVLWQPIPRFACAAALLVSSFAAYQGTVIHNLKQIQILAVADAELQPARDGEPLIVQDGQAIKFFPKKVSRTYDVKLSKKSGETIYSGKISAPETANVIQILPPRGTLKPGDYLFSVQGSEGDKTDIAFKLEWPK